MLCFCRRAYYGLNRNGSAEGSERHRQFLGDDTASGIQSHLRPSKPCHQHPEEGPRDGQIFGEGCVNFEDTPNRVHHHLLRYHPGSWRSSWNHQDAPQGHEGSYLGSIIILWYLRETVVDGTPSCKGGNTRNKYGWCWHLVASLVGCFLLGDNLFTLQPGGATDSASATIKEIAELHRMLNFIVF